MLTNRIIPCFDVDRGRVVKGVSFVELRDAGDPVELARLYDREGADELVFLDITASSDDRATVYDMVSATADQVFIPFTVGGGIRSSDDMRTMLELGADKVSINTAAVSNPDLVNEGAHRFGAQCIVVAIDARRLDTFSAMMTLSLFCGSSSPKEVLSLSFDASKPAPSTESSATNKVAKGRSSCSLVKRANSVRARSPPWARRTDSVGLLSGLDGGSAMCAFGS